MKPSMVIIGVTNDEYELPVKVYLSIKEMSEDLQINMKRCYDLIHKKCLHRKTNLKFYKFKNIED